MASVNFLLSQPFDVAPRLPGSKSIANRALVAAALARGTTAFTRLTPSDDVAAMVAGLRAMGVAVVERGAEQLDVGGGPPGRVAEATIDCGLGGTTARFLLALAAVVPGRWTITGGARLRERPMGELLAALSQLGARIEGGATSLPVTIVGGTLEGGRVRLDASRSSQFLSALLLVGAATKKGIEVEIEGAIASEPYVEMTADVLERFGVTIGFTRDPARATRRFTVAPQTAIAPGPFAIDPDWSAAGAWLVLERLAHSHVDLAPLRRSQFRDDDPIVTQPDAAMPALLEKLVVGGPVTLDVSRTPDQLMNLAVAAARREGVTRFTGAANLRVKESDRLAVLAEQLGRAGIRVEVELDGIVVHGPAKLRAATLDSSGDHRMAIAFALLAALHPGIEIAGRECVTKSDPRFFEELERATRTPRCIALVGMRGAGKTTLGTALAARLGLPFFDSDAEFEKLGGPIAEFVTKRGWKEFRTAEMVLADELLAPARVVALGGGALENSRTLAVVPERAIVLHVDEPIETLRARIAGSSRPSVTGGDPLAELPGLLERRAHGYRKVATITLAPGRTVAERVEEAVAALAALVRWN